MKKFIFFLMIIFIIIALSLIVIKNSVNGDNKSNLILAEEQPMKIENDQFNVIEEPENKVIEDNIEVEEVQNNTETAEIIDQPQIQETHKEEKVISSTPKIEKTTQVVQTKKVETQPQEVKHEVKEEPKEEPKVVDTPKQETPKQEEPKKVETPKCSGNNHGVGTGNSGRWFNSETEAINYYKSIIKTWGDKWEKFEIDDETYNKNCPYGYDDWSCPYCGKWTINFYYN